MRISDWSSDVCSSDLTPQDLKLQYPAIVEMIEGLGLPVIAEPDVEADDVIGTYAQRAADRGQHVLIVTGDKDMAQLVGDCVKLLDTMKNRTMAHDGVIERFGVPPGRLFDYLALMGARADNITGLPHAGPTTHAKYT